MIAAIIIILFLDPSSFISSNNKVNIYYIETESSKFQKLNTYRGL